MKNTFCRNEILEAIDYIITSERKSTFTVLEILTYMKSRNTKYSESTIRTHVSSRMCVNAKKHHGVKYDDIIRIKYGVYEIYKK